jgi:hypothetical protein
LRRKPDVPDEFEYAVVRVVPRVEREEFLNAGIILYCPKQDFLRIAVDLNASCLSALDSSVSTGDIEEHLRAFERVCAGGEQAGDIGTLPAGERFRWLTAPRSTIVQTSPVHTGLCTNAQETLEHLLSTLVQRDSTSG